MFEKIEIIDQEIGRFQDTPVFVRVSDLKERNNLSVKMVTVGDETVLDVTIASGRPGIFNYIELGNIREVIDVKGNEISYFGSELEDIILGYFSGLMTRADIIHVPYYNDPETWNQLQSNVPPALSRLGYKLFNLGFTWFKDFYIAEGWMEGPVKLTAQKPVDEEMIRRNLASIKKDVGRYLESIQSSQTREGGRVVLEMIEKYSDQPSLLLTP